MCSRKAASLPVRGSVLPPRLLLEPRCSLGPGLADLGTSADQCWCTDLYFWEVTEAFPTLRKRHIEEQLWSRRLSSEDSRTLGYQWQRITLYSRSGAQVGPVSAVYA